MSRKVINKNKKAFFNYEIRDRVEAGVVLTGAEVKAIKNSQINLNDSFVKIEKGEAWLWNAEIPQYKFSDLDEYDPRRTRKLLLKKKEIDWLQSKVDQKRLTIVPLLVYLTRGKVKIEIGLGKGKKSYDKKRKLKEKDLERELHREKRRYMIK